MYNTAFGIVGMRIIADPLRKCPKCGGAVERCGDEWKAERVENPQRRKTIR
jgi:hypothetical protein